MRLTWLHTVACCMRHACLVSACCCPETLVQSPGFLAVPGFASAEEVAALRARADELVAAFDPQSVSIFSTKYDDQVRVPAMAQLEEAPPTYYNY